MAIFSLFRYEQLKMIKFFEKVALVVATGFGSGYVPVAPGTAGSAVALPLVWTLFHFGGIKFVVIGTIIVAVIAVISANRAEKYFGGHDNQHIVIDEVAGQMLSLIAVPATLPNLLVAFGWFRLFDSWKPWPVYLIDRHVKGGFGVVADDLAAAVYAAGCTFFMAHFGLIAKGASLIKIN